MRDSCGCGSLVFVPHVFDIDRAGKRHVPAAKMLSEFRILTVCGLVGGICCLVQTTIEYQQRSYKRTVTHNRGQVSRNCCAPVAENNRGSICFLLLLLLLSPHVPR